jgi:hypothetical protein
MGHLSVCASILSCSTFPEESYYLWSAVECGKHDGDPTILTYVRDCLDSCGRTVSFWVGSRRIYVPLPVRSSYHTLRSFMTWNVPATPFGDTLI